ncbi:LysE family translocator [Mesorhizobium sp. Cs1299R1N3]|uniref:LysE family translocator n=1 Tax=Mesorhizobium sp. Cs1299R1N3 TaxID=3015173 RepID=UPI00301CCE33
MFPIDIWLAYTTASVVIVIAPGPDVVLSISRGLTQGRAAATLSALGAASGILLHSMAAAFGLAIIMQTSDIGFVALKLVGATYLIGMGVRALLHRNLLTFTPTARRSLREVYLAGLLSNVLNPKIGLFVLAFVPQFASAERGPIDIQILVYGAWLAIIAAAGIALIGSVAAGSNTWLRQRPRAIAGINIGAGLTFIAAGLSAVTLTTG